MMSNAVVHLWDCERELTSTDAAHSVDEADEVVCPERVAGSIFLISARLENIFKLCNQRLQKHLQGGLAHAFGADK